MPAKQENKEQIRSKVQIETSAQIVTKHTFRRISNTIIMATDLQYLIPKDKFSFMKDKTKVSIKLPLSEGIFPVT